MKTTIGYVLACLVSCSGGTSGGTMEKCQLAWQGDKAFVTKIDLAFRTLAPQDQQYIRDVTCLIEQGPQTWPVYPSTIRIGEPEFSQSPTWLGSSLVHEACHIHRGLVAGVNEERICNARQLVALKRAGASQSEIDHLASQDGTHVCNIIPSAEGCS